MRFYQIYKIIIGLVFVLVGCATQSPPPSASVTEQSPRPVGVVFPYDYRETFVHYATVDRIDGITRNIYIDADSLAAWSPGAPLPNGTTLVIEAYQAERGTDEEYLVTGDGRLVPSHPLDMLHVMQKRDDWQAADFAGENRTGRWNFGSFDFATGERLDENLMTCFNCHNAAPSTEFVYTLPHLATYWRTGETRYFVCNLSGRTAC